MNICGYRSSWFPSLVTLLCFILVIIGNRQSGTWVVIRGLSLIIQKNAPWVVFLPSEFNSTNWYTLYVCSWCRPSQNVGRMIIFISQSSLITADHLFLIDAFITPKYRGSSPNRQIRCYEILVLDDHLSFYQGRDLPVIKQALVIVVQGRSWYSWDENHSDLLVEERIFELFHKSLKITIWWFTWITLLIQLLGAFRRVRNSFRLLFQT